MKFAISSFFMNQFPPDPCASLQGHFIFMRKFLEIFLNFVFIAGGSRGFEAYGVYFVRIEEHIAGVDLEVGILGFDALAR
jgi:hypothetical protein